MYSLLGLQTDFGLTTLDIPPTYSLHLSIDILSELLRFPFILFLYGETRKTYYPTQKPTSLQSRVHRLTTKSGLSIQLPRVGFFVNDRLQPPQTLQPLPLSLLLNRPLDSDSSNVVNCAAYWYTDPVFTASASAAKN